MAGNVKLGDFVQRLAWRLGYQVRRLPARRRAHRGMDAFEDQGLLIAPDTSQVIFDVGANVGSVSLRYATLCPRATVHAFEPFPDTFRELSAAVADEARIHTHNLAISDTSGSRAFFVNQDHQTNSLLKIAPSYNESYANSAATNPVGEVVVQTTTIDDFCELHAIPHVHILKMDIQGGELMALQGAARMLAGNHIDLIYSEVLFAKTYEQQAYFYQLGSLLAQHGYLLLDLYPPNYARNGMVSWTDAIWLSPRLEARLNAASGPRPTNAPPATAIAPGSTSSG